MSGRDLARLADIVEAVGAIQAHLARGGLEDDLVYDAVRVRLIEIGSAVESVSDELLAAEPDVPWGTLARMRDHLAHRDFDPERAFVQQVVVHELGPLLLAVRSLLDRLERPAGESAPSAN